MAASVLISFLETQRGHNVRNGISTMLGGICGNRSHHGSDVVEEGCSGAEVA